MRPGTWRLGVRGRGMLAQPPSLWNEPLLSLGRKSHVAGHMKLERVTLEPGVNRVGAPRCHDDRTDSSWASVRLLIP